MRLFLAIRMEDGILRGLSETIDRLRATRAAVRWVRPEGIHLTVRFLGETDPDRLSSLIGGMTRICSGFEPFPIAVQGMGSYPDSRRPRVVWAGVDEPSGTLARLWTSTEKAVADLGWEREKRGFSPHITLGRVKGPINLPLLAEALRAMAEERWGMQEVRDLVLYRSRLEGGGARYEQMAVFPLGKPLAPLP